MNTDDAWRLIERDMRFALAVALFVEFGFVVSLFALAGAFNGGRPTTTPPFAVVYLITSFLVTIPVILRTRQMLNAAKRRDLGSLQRMKVRAWMLVSFAFSALLPSIFLNDAARLLESLARR